MPREISKCELCPCLVGKAIDTESEQPTEKSLRDNQEQLLEKPFVIIVNSIVGKNHIFYNKSHVVIDDSKILISYQSCNKVEALFGPRKTKGSRIDGGWL